MSRLNSEMKNMKRTLILERAAEMFEQQGYEEMKVSTLAKEVGVSVGSIYAYFDSKEGLYSAWVLQEIEGAYIHLFALIEKNLTFEELIRASIAIKFSIFVQKKRSLASGAMSNPFFFESQQIAHKVAFEKLYGLYIEPIEKVKKVEIDTMQLVYLLNAMGNAYVLRWIEGEIEDLEAKVDEVATTFVRLVKGC
jgi:AcrR family transcriptional regulator